MKHQFLFIILFIGIKSVFAQNISAKLIDKNTNIPIPYATVKTGEFSGVITNEEGYFTLNSEVSETTPLSISCMGYTSKTLTIKDIKAQNYIIKLETAVNQLNEVYVSNRKPHADSIIARVKRKLSVNYNTNLTKYNFFSRRTDYIDFENLDFEIDKASQVKKQQLDKANADLEALSRDFRNSKTVHFSDYKGELFIQNKDSSKLRISKATEIIDQEKDVSLDEVQNRAQNIVLKYLDTTKTYKVKSGLFKVEDSLSLKSEKRNAQKKAGQPIKYFKSSTRTLLNRSQFYDNSFLSDVLDSKLYDYTLEDMTTNSESLTYIINYKPRKGKAKYSGKLYITDGDYAITKVEYSFFEDRHGDKFNLKFLLGIKYIQNVNNGLILYQKAENNTYQPKYIKEEEGSYFYVGRDLTLIENSKDRYKVSSTFKISGNNLNKEELLITANNTITLNDFNAVKEEKNFKIQTHSKFEKNIWENEEILEPLEEMKRFGSE